MLRQSDIRSFINSEAVCALKDVESNFLCMSNTLKAFLGIRANQAIINTTDSDYFDEEFSNQYRKSDKAALANGFWAGIESITDKNGNIIDVFVMKTLIYDAENTASGILVVLLFSSSLYSISQTTKPYHINNKSSINLTQREQECLYYTLRGKSAREIAEIFGISRRTVETHIVRLKTKFDCHKRSELIEKALDMNIFELVATT